MCSVPISESATSSSISKEVFSFNCRPLYAESTRITPIKSQSRWVQIVREHHDSLRLFLEQNSYIADLCTSLANNWLNWMLFTWEAALELDLITINFCWQKKNHLMTTLETTKSLNVSIKAYNLLISRFTYVIIMKPSSQLTLTNDQSRKKYEKQAINVAQIITHHQRAHKRER